MITGRVTDPDPDKTGGDPRFQGDHLGVSDRIRGVQRARLRPRSRHRRRSAARFVGRQDLDIEPAGWRGPRQGHGDCQRGLKDRLSLGDGCRTDRQSARLDDDVRRPIGDRPQPKRAAERADRKLAAPTRRDLPIVVHADAITRRGAADAQPVRPACRAQGDDAIVAQIGRAVRLIQVPLALRDIHPLPGHGIAQIEIAGRQNRRRGGRRNDADLGDIQRENGRAGLITDRAQHRVELRDGLPVTPAGQPRGDGILAVAGRLTPLDARQIPGIFLIIGVRHEAAAAIHRCDGPALVVSQVVVGQVQQVVAKFMSQGALPITGQLGTVFAIGIPRRAHTDLAGQERFGDGLAGADDVIRRGIHHTAHRRAGAHAAVGVDHDIAIQPVFLVLKNPDLSQRHLTAADVKEGLGCALDRFRKIGQKCPVVAGVPFQRDIQIEKQQRVSG